MKFRAGLTICMMLLLILGGCTYGHYLGLHGSSIRSYPDVHAGAREDRQCLECHHPGKSPTGPPTSHPEFTGCLKCHNDPVR